MKTSASDGGNSGGAAGSRNRKTKRRRVTADPKALPMPKQLQDDDEQTSAAPKGSANDGGNEKAIVRASASEIDGILPNVTRGGFEQLVRRQLVEGIPITLADLTAAAQSASKRKAKSSSSSSSDTGRKLRKFSFDSTPATKETRVINTEGWAGIPSDVMRDVLGRLNLRDKVVCVSKVCRAWNAFKTIPGLFVDLSDDSGPPTANDLDKLLKWVPDAKSVTGVRVATTEGCGYFSACTALSEIEAAHRSAESRALLEEAVLNGSLDDLTATHHESPAYYGMKKLVLTGPKINAVLLHGMNGLGCALQILRIDNVSRDELRLSSFLKKTLSNCAKLEVLEVPMVLLFSDVVMSRGNFDLSVALSSMIPPCGTCNSLKVLDLTKTMSDLGSSVLRGMTMVSMPSCVSLQHILPGILLAFFHPTYYCCSYCQPREHRRASSGQMSLVLGSFVLVWRC